MNSSGSQKINRPYSALGILGPTASGKSALGIRLAKALNGEIVNVDSVQVYTDLSIGSAKVPESEREGVPHHCLDIFPPTAQANVAQFKEHALQAIEEISTRGRLPILVGGSGMYLTVLLHGIAELPDVSPEIREKIQLLSSEEMYAKLQTLDPLTAQRLHPNDRQRVSRALEVYETTQVAPSTLYESHQFKESPVHALLVVLCHPRDALYERINLRSSLMVRAGLIDETKGVLERYGDTPLLDTIGYAQAKAHLAGELQEERLVEEIALHTRRYAKRQMTYLRNEPVKRGWKVHPTEGDSAHLLDAEVVGEKKARRAREPQKSFKVLRFTEAELLAAVRERLQRGIEGSEVWYVELLRDEAT